MIELVVEMNVSPASTGYFYFTAFTQPEGWICCREFGGAANILTPERALWPGMYFWQISEPRASY